MTPRKTSFRVATHVMDTLTGAALLVASPLAFLALDGRGFSMDDLFRTMLPMFAPSAVLLVIAIRLRHRDRWALVATWFVAGAILLAPWALFVVVLFSGDLPAAAAVLIAAICFSGVGGILLRTLRTVRDCGDSDAPTPGFEVVQRVVPVDQPIDTDRGKKS